VLRRRRIHVCHRRRRIYVPLITVPRAPFHAEIPYTSE